jgi:hypothetical protein
MVVLESVLDGNFWNLYNRIVKIKENRRVRWKKYTHQAFEITRLSLYTSHSIITNCN